jgi:hypothetical protein
MADIQHNSVDRATPLPELSGIAPGMEVRPLTWEAFLIVDHRTYRIKPGHTQAHLSIYEEFGFAAQTRHLGQPFAYMFAETGDVNTIVHQWAYDDAADRARRRAAMMADPEWQVYLKKLNESGLLIGQMTSIMIPAKFCPIKR